uniref:RNA helicase n=1 Tax=Clastoptera arizonana TaxID=38151 RepID=A0A1B6D6A9_9HEMI
MDKKFKKSKRYKRRSSSSESGHEYHEKKYKRNKEKSKQRPDKLNSSTSHHHQPSTSNVHTDNKFTFELYKYEFNKVFFRNSNLISDIDDFWLFLKKYEKIQEKAKLNQKSREDKIPLNLETYDKTLLVNLRLSSKESELFARLPPSISRDQFKDFYSVLLLYLDFKHKERFLKLKKLRDLQANLPVYHFRDEIVTTIAKERVVIIAGDTGCGKSTQVPQYLLKSGYTSIACTQPRRIACISLSKRVAFETLNEYTKEIGYQIRFEKNRNQETKILFITEGLLLRQISGSGTLNDYDVVVLDEVHERHLHGDFLLGIVKCLLFQKSDLKVILMSATININLFSDYFGDNAAVIQVPGRLHPINLHYRPILIEEKLSKNERLNPAPYIQIMQLIDEKYPKDERGDLLIFLSGMSEITSIIDAAHQYNEKTQRWIILPLHSTLSLTDQDKVFDYPPDGIRKCIVSTNIAETSITIDGIRFVVDSGKVKEMSYDPVCKMQRLKEFWISQASAEQRKGRAGRTGPGVCFRIYSEEDFSAMAPYTTPEIQRVPLDSLLLQMIAMGLPDARKFPFIEPPPQDSIENAILTLKHHAALTDNEKITNMGELLAKLPVDISLGKMLITGTLFHQIEPVLSLAAVLSVQNPFTNRAYRDSDCQTLIKELESDHGDPLTLLNAFREWLEVKQRERGASKKWCRKRGLEEQRFYEMTKLRSQFKELLQDCGLLNLNAPLTELSSAERALRHGEVKLLKSMKRSIQNESPRKKRLLKMDTWTIDDEEDKTIDIRDVDFRLKNDTSQIQNLLSGSTACSYTDLTILKIILSSGLYPQVAIPDEFNHSKTVGEMFFHTESKPFVALHPMSFFANNSKVIQLDEGDIIDGPKKFPQSNKHQILFYMSLLETAKPYLVNSLRMPAAQTLLLFCQQLHTNCNFTKIVCDSWLEIQFSLSEAAENLIQKVVKLRSKWELLLKLRLEEKESATTEKSLTQELISLMNSQINYSLRRLVAGHLKTIYLGPENSENIFTGTNPFCPEFKIKANERLGGIYLTPYMTFNCLVDSELDLITWSCSHCGLTAALNSLEKLQHLYQCQPESISLGDAASFTDEQPKKPNSEAYSCDTCKKVLYLTPIEILKHKRQHVL